MKGILLVYSYVLLVMMLLSLFLYVIGFKAEYQKKRYQYRSVLESTIAEMKPNEAIDVSFMDLMDDKEGNVVSITHHFYPKLLRVVFKTKIKGVPVVFDELMIEEGYNA